MIAYFNWPILLHGGSRILTISVGSLGSPGPAALIGTIRNWNSLSFGRLPMVVLRPDSVPECALYVVTVCYRLSV